MPGAFVRQDAVFGLFLLNAQDHNVCVEGLISLISFFYESGPFASDLIYIFV